MLEARCILLAPPVQPRLPCWPSGLQMPASCCRVSKSLFMNSTVCWNNLVPAGKRFVSHPPDEFCPLPLRACSGLISTSGASDVSHVLLRMEHIPMSRHDRFASTGQSSIFLLLLCLLSSTKAPRSPSGRETSRFCDYSQIVPCPCHRTPPRATTSTVQG